MRLRASGIDFGSEHAATCIQTERRVWWAITRHRRGERLDVVACRSCCSELVQFIDDMRSRLAALKVNYGSVWKLNRTDGHSQGYKANNKANGEALKMSGARMTFGSYRLVIIALRLKVIGKELKLKPSLRNRCCSWLLKSHPQFQR